MLAIGRTLAIKFLKIQLLVAVGFAVLWLFIPPQVNALSALVGGGISLMGNALFVRMAFKHAGAQQAQRILGSFFLAEFFKILLIVTAFACVFIMTSLPALPLFTGFIFVQAVFWFAPLIFRKSVQQVNHA